MEIDAARIVVLAVDVVDVCHGARQVDLLRERHDRDQRLGLVVGRQHGVDEALGRDLKLGQLSARGRGRIPAHRARDVQHQRDLEPGRRLDSTGLHIHIQLVDPDHAQKDGVQRTRGGGHDRPPAGGLGHAGDQVDALGTIDPRGHVIIDHVGGLLVDRQLAVGIVDLVAVGGCQDPAVERVLQIRARHVLALVVKGHAADHH